MGVLKGINLSNCRGVEQVIYAAYKGEEIVAMGTLKEVAQALRIKESSVIWYTKPSAKKRTEKYKNGRTIIKFEEEWSE